MGIIDIKFNTKDFEKVLDRIERQTDKIEMSALNEMAGELLRLSSREVPHDEGILQSSGNIYQDLTDRETINIGYHTPYAARLHEHPEYKFQKGRKAKYLQDPLLHNLTKWLTIYAGELERALQ